MWLIAGLRRDVCKLGLPRLIMHEGRDARRGSCPRHLRANRKMLPRLTTDDPVVKGRRCLPSLTPIAATQLLLQEITVIASSSVLTALLSLPLPNAHLPKLSGVPMSLLSTVNPQPVKGRSRHSFPRSWDRALLGGHAR